MSKHHKKKVDNQRSHSSSPAPKITPRKPWVSISIFGLIAIFALSFIYMNFLAPASNNNNNNASNIPPPMKVAEPEFVKEGELTFSNETKELIKIDIEVADTEKSIIQGLMYRKSMEEKHGMLFKFPNMEKRNFWMKNTIISLDIIYVDDQKKIVSIQKNTIPYSEDQVPSHVPAQYVIEVNAGFCDSYGIKVGDFVDF